MLLERTPHSVRSSRSQPARSATAPLSARPSRPQRASSSPTPGSASGSTAILALGVAKRGGEGVSKGGDFAMRESRASAESRETP